MSGKLRCVMVGLGNRGHYVMKQVLAHPEFEVVALAEPSAELLERARQTGDLPESACHTDLEAALATPGAQACIINTPPQLHAAHLRAAFAHDLPAFIAKPLTRDFAEARELVELAESKNLALVVDQQQRFSHSEQKLAEWVEQKHFGLLNFGTFTFHRNRPKMHHSTDEHPFLWEQAVHSFNSLLAIIGRRAVRVRAYEHKPARSEYNGPTVCAGVLEFAGEDGGQEIPINFFGSYHSHNQQTEMRFEFEQAAVTFHTESRQRLCIIKNGEPPLNIELANQSGALEKNNLDLFCQAIYQGGRVANDGRDNLRTLALIDAFIRASQTGCEAEVVDVG